MLASVVIDGTAVANTLNLKANELLTISSIITSKTTRAPFVFSSLRMTDDESVAKANDTSLKDFGVIRVQVSRVRLAQKAEFQPKYKAIGDKTVHERNKKATLGGLQVK